LVLVVEDEESFVDALRVGLDREGFDVEVAIDGVQALEVFDATRPDLILLDLMLPKLSGIDVCRRPARAQRGPDHRRVGEVRGDRHGPAASRWARTTS